MNALRMGPPASLMVGWLTMFVVGTDLFVVSPLLPMIAADYRVSPAVAGLSVTAFALTYMISAPLFGHVADRIGRRRMLVCCLAASSAVARLFFPAQQAGLATDFPTRRATLLAWNNSALFFGITLGSLVGGQAVALAGFEANLVISAGIALSGCIITGIVMLAPARMRPADDPI